MADNIHADSVVSAKRVLAVNDHGTHTIPARGLYPHQWLWDSCFIAIGLRHINPHRAQRELVSLVNGQWRNGMLPHMILHPEGWRSLHMWQSHRAYFSSRKVNTSGITQPPVLAEAVWKVAETLPAEQRRKFLEHMYSPLVRHHQWLYRDRDPHGEGLVLLVHPWESGMDNTPPWMKEMHANRTPHWIRLVRWSGLIGVIELLRRDRRWILDGQRASTTDMITLYSIQRRLRRKRYDIHAILRHTFFAVEDLAFNSILIRNNQVLKDIAKELHEKLPPELHASMEKTPHALELLWHEETKQYYSRNFVTHELVVEPSIAALIPLYGGAVSKKRAAQLVQLMKNGHHYWTDFPLPSVPHSSSEFKANQYWQGPSWVNMNWLVIEGLQRYGYHDEAEELRQRTLKMVDIAGMREYFNPLTGKGLGAENFSWTAALIIDLLNETKTAHK